VKKKKRKKQKQKKLKKQLKQLKQLKQQQKQEQNVQLEQGEDSKVMRLAHRILTETIWPANLSIEEAFDVAIVVIKALVVSNIDDDDDDDLDDRAEMIEWVEDRFLEAMHDLNSHAECTRAWLVSPQGLITEPVGFLWSGFGGGVDVLIGAELEELRVELNSEEAKDVIVTEGVDGIAMTDPEWDGEPTVTCANPGCGKNHDVHLLVAENLFQHAKQMRQESAPN
jgi:hypothetical protein